MSDTKISADTSTTSISGAEFLPIVQNLTNYKITPNNLLASSATSAYVVTQFASHLSTYTHSTYITSLIPTNIMSSHIATYAHDTFITSSLLITDIRSLTGVGSASLLTDQLLLTTANSVFDTVSLDATFFGKVSTELSFISTGVTSGHVPTADGANAVTWQAQTGGSGFTQLQSMSDVAIASPATVDFLAYNGSSWINTPFGVGAGFTQLQSMSDVAIATPATVDQLLYNGSSWINTPFGGGSGTMTTVKKGGVQVGGADIVTLDFDGDDFNITEDPNTEINIVLDTGISDNNIVEVDSATIASLDYAKFTANGLEGRSYTEVMADLSGQAGADFAMGTNKITGVTDPTGDQDVATKKYVDTSVIPFKGLADVKLEYVSASQITLGGIEGTSEFIYVNGEFLDCSTPLTIDYDDNLLAADGTDSSGAPTDATLYYVYASNSQASYRASGIGLSASAPTGGYLAASGNGAEWRLVGWVYLIDNGGTAEFRDSLTERLVISKWNPTRIKGYNSESTNHTYTTTSWRYYYNSLATTQIKFIAHEDYLNVDLMAWVRYSTNTTYCQVAIGVDNTTHISETNLQTYTAGLGYNRKGASAVKVCTAGYHYAALLQYGNANSGTYTDGMITIQLWG